MTSKYASGTSVKCMEHLNNGVSQVPLQTFESDHISPIPHAFHDSHYNARRKLRAVRAFLFLSVSPLSPVLSLRPQSSDNCERSPVSLLVV